MGKQTQLADDWTSNWQTSIALKITAVVMWVIIPFGFLVALFLGWNVQERIETSINDDAQTLLNSARVLLADNDSYTSRKVATTLEHQLEKSVYCKLILSTHSASDILLLKDECGAKTSGLLNKTYYFSALFANNPEEAKMSIFRQSMDSMIAKERANTILAIIVSVIFSGLILVWVIRLLILKPLLKMVDTARMISSGKHALRIRIDQHDEFGYLAKFLNQMLDNLFEQQNNLKQTNLQLMKEIAQRNRIALELRTHRDQLEQLIRERTIDLAIARDQALEANKAKNQFLANMSHEIRTTLYAILGYSQLLRRGNNLHARQSKSIDIIEDSGNRLLGLLNDILDISRIEAGRTELNKINFDLNELVQSISINFSERCTGKGLEWEILNGLQGQVLVESDPHKLRQILINLLGIAVKFTDKGKVSFIISMLDDNRYYFEIADTGPGIPIDDQDLILEAFEQDKLLTDRGGSGLGLAITRKQLELLNAELKFNSTEGEGSIFSFELQLDSARVGFEIRKDRENEVIQLIQHRTINLLVVDDVELSRLLLTDMLSETTASVKAVNNGLEAIEYIHAAAENQKPDMVFMDIHMQVMNGIEAMQQIKRQYGDQIICVALTALFMEDSETDYLKAGFDDYISSPYRFDDVFNCLQRHLQVDLKNEHQL
jgi:signal transduction histidine kinase/ActR/RegA family two-component response regulator